MQLTKIGSDSLNGFPEWAVFGDTAQWEDKELVFDREFLFSHLVEGIFPVDSLTVTVDPAAECEVDWDGDVLLITPPVDWFGEDQVRLTANDPSGGRCFMELKFTIVSVNDPPDPFTLRAPLDSVDLNNAQVVFVWNEAKQNKYETDFVNYGIFLKVQDKSARLHRTEERTLVVDDLLAVIDEMGFNNGDPIGMVEWWVMAYDAADSTECTKRFHLNVDEILRCPLQSTTDPAHFRYLLNLSRPFQLYHHHLLLG